MNEPNWTALQLDLILHYHAFPDPYPRENSVVIEQRAELMRRGLLEPDSSKASFSLNSQRPRVRGNASSHATPNRKTNLGRSQSMTPEQFTHLIQVLHGIEGPLWGIMIVLGGRLVLSSLKR